MINMNQIIFFTDITTNCSNFCLLNIKQYSKKKHLNKFLYLIDPSVYELKNNIEYSQIDLLHSIAKENKELISIDYPCDMNLEYSDLFIEKSIQNNLKYAKNNCYIATIQFKFLDFIDFKKQFEYLEENIDFTQKIIGIGNLCRILSSNEFTDKVFKYLNSKKYFYHFYGLGFRLIKKYIHLFDFCSIDSTKWTKAITNDFKLQNGVCCRKFNRNKYFLKYISELSKFAEIIY